MNIISLISGPALAVGLEAVQPSSLESVAQTAERHPLFCLASLVVWLGSQYLSVRGVRGHAAQVATEVVSQAVLAAAKDADERLGLGSREVSGQSQEASTGNPGGRGQGE